MTRYITLAEQVTSFDAEILAETSQSDLADSTLHAPQAAFRGIEFTSSRFGVV